MTDAVVAGATDDAIKGVHVAVQRAFDTSPDDVRHCNGIILGTPSNFGYMSGALKDFFDRVYYEVIEDTPGLPYALFVKASTDGDGAVRSVERIVAGLRWKLVVPPVVVVGDLGPDDLHLHRRPGRATQRRDPVQTRRGQLGAGDGGEKQEDRDGKNAHSFALFK